MKAMLRRRLEALEAAQDAGSDYPERERLARWLKCLSVIYNGVSLSEARVNPAEVDVGQEDARFEAAMAQVYGEKERET